MNTNNIVVTTVACITLSSLAFACEIEFRPPVTHCFKSGPFAGHAVYFGNIETDAHGERVFHVSVQGPFKVSTEKGDTVIPLFGHMPFSSEAINKTHLAECDLKFSPDILLAKGIDIWRHQNGGVYSIAIDDAVVLGLETISLSKALKD